MLFSTEVIKRQTGEPNVPSVEHEQVVAMMSGGLALDELSIEEQRAVMEASADLFPPEADVVARQIDAGGVTSDWVTVDASEPDRVVLYLHGGGYVMGSRNTHRGLAGRIARAARARVLLPDYRLAPEHPFPAAVEDARPAGAGCSLKVMPQDAWPSPATPLAGV